MTISKKQIVSILAIIVIGISVSAMLVLPGKTGAIQESGEHGETHAGENETSGDPHQDHPEGPHEGELATDGEMTLEMLLSEDGGEPRLRLWATLKGKPATPETLVATGELKRPNGQTQTLSFTAKEGYLQSEQIIEEPHFFSLTIKASLSDEKVAMVAHLEKEEGKVALSADQVAAAGMKIDTVGPARLQGTLQFPGEIKFNADRTAHVVPRLAGVVDSAPANIGQEVKAGEVLATISSAVLSDMRSELLASQRRLTLATTTHERERRLWRDKVSAEQDYLQAKTSLSEAQITVQNAKQKLAAMGATAESKELGRLDLRAPFDSVVIEKHITLGEAVKEDANIFTLSDLRTVWAEFLISAKDLERIRVGEKAHITSTAFAGNAEGTVSYVGALLGQQTRTATARVTLNNPDASWRPGLFVTVDVVVNEIEAPVAVAASAVQSIGDEEIVFIEVPGGFVAQPVKVGRTNNRYAEVTSGLTAGVRYVSENSFILKSELGKASAEHAH